MVSISYVTNFVTIQPFGYPVTSLYHRNFEPTTENTAILILDGATNCMPKE